VPLAAALDFMEANLGQDISREDIARAAHLSPHHFSRLFKTHMGRSCGDMLSQMRADKAAEMLTRTDKSLAAIAIDCGFHDQSYFTKVFRRHFSATPLAYRNRQPAGGVATPAPSHGAAAAPSAEAFRTAAALPRQADAGAAAPTSAGSASSGARPRSRRRPEHVDLRTLAEAVFQGDYDRVKRVTAQAVAEGMDPKEVLGQGLVAGMNEIGRRFKANEVYVPEVLISARAMKGGMEILQPALAKACVEPIGTVVLGTVQGDLHDIGKNLVRMMLTGAGLKVIDIGTDVPAKGFVEACKAHNASICAMSALLTTTMPQVAEVVKALKAANLKARTLIGGAPLTQRYADEIGADGYAPDAGSAVDRARELVGAA